MELQMNLEELRTLGCDARIHMAEMLVYPRQLLTSAQLDEINLDKVAIIEELLLEPNPYGHANDEMGLLSAPMHLTPLALNNSDHVRVTIPDTIKNRYVTTTYDHATYTHYLKPNA
jgi:hypothetical protein